MPRNYSFKDSHTPGLTTLDIQVRGLYPEQKQYHGVTDASPQLTLFAEAFPVNRIPSLGDGWVPPTSVTSGPSSLDSFASLDPDGSWRKTSQGYCQVMLDGSLEAFCETWPRAGCMRNGIAYQQVPLVPLTDATASGWWPTPTSGDAKSSGSRNTPTSQAHFGVSLTDAVRGDAGTGRRWPTPSARDWKDGRHSDATWNKGARPLNEAVVRESFDRQTDWGASGQLNPTWVEWLMGFPLGWTDCGHSATRSSRRLPNGSGGGFLRLRPK